MTQIPLIDESRLVTLINDLRSASRRWHNSSACADLPPAGDPYFPKDGELPPTEALARCITCTVADECLATALVHESEEGIRVGWWGGCSPDERQLLAERIGITTRPVEIELRRTADLARILRGQNRTIASIAAELGCTERTVYRYLASTAA
jgi:hypothetical protein